MHRTRWLAAAAWVVSMLAGCSGASHPDALTTLPTDTPAVSVTEVQAAAATPTPPPRATPRNTTVPVTAYATSEPAPTPGDPPPALTLILPDGAAVTARMGGLCWPTLDCVDGPPPLIEEFSLIGADRVIRLRFASEPVPDRVFLALNAAPWIPETDSGADASIEFTLLGETFEWKPDVQPGDYVLGVSAAWATAFRASVSYWIGVSIP